MIKLLYFRWSLNKYKRFLLVLFVIGLIEYAFFQLLQIILTIKFLDTVITITNSKYYFATFYFIWYWLFVFFCIILLRWIIYSVRNYFKNITPNRWLFYFFYWIVWICTYIVFRIISLLIQSAIKQYQAYECKNMEHEYSWVIKITSKWKDVVIWWSTYLIKNYSDFLDNKGDWNKNSVNYSHRQFIGSGIISYNMLIGSYNIKECGWRWNCNYWVYKYRKCTWYFTIDSLSEVSFSNN